MVIGVTLLLLLGTAFAVLRVKFEGEDLGDNIASILNKRMRGRIEIGSIEWPTAALKTRGDRRLGPGHPPRRQGVGRLRTQRRVLAARRRVPDRRPERGLHPG